MSRAGERQETASEGRKKKNEGQLFLPVPFPATIFFLCCCRPAHAAIRYGETLKLGGCHRPIPPPAGPHYWASAQIALSWGGATWRSPSASGDLQRTHSTPHLAPASKVVPCTVFNHRGHFFLVCGVSPHVRCGGLEVEKKLLGLRGGRCFSGAGRIWVVLMRSGQGPRVFDRRCLRALGPARRGPRFPLSHVAKMEKDHAHKKKNYYQSPPAWRWATAGPVRAMKKADHPPAPHAGRRPRPPPTICPRRNSPTR